MGWAYGEVKKRRGEAKAQNNIKTSGWASEALQTQRENESYLGNFFFLKNTNNRQA